MDIIIGFSRRKMAFSRFLQWTERRPYSHCYVRIKNHVTGQDLILHAAGLSIHTLTLENFQKHGNIIVKEYTLDVSDKQAMKNAMEFWYSVSGNPYGWIQLVGMGLVKFVTFWANVFNCDCKISNPLADHTKTMVCSEFCAHVIEKTQLTKIDTGYAELGGPSWVDATLQAAEIPVKYY